MKALVTRCPHCTTAFRVGLTQMSAADGVVRCGVCNQIFHADKHLVETPLSDDPSGLSESYVRELLQEFIGPDPGDTETGAEDRTSAAQQTPPQAGFAADVAPATTPGFSAAATEPSPEAEAAPAVEAEAEADTTITAAADPPPATLPHETPVDAPAAPVTGPDPELDAGRSEPESPVDLGTALPAGFAIPIEIDAPRHPPSRAVRAGWTLAALGAACALVLQYGWYHRDSLARDPRLRPAYAMLCARIGCALPSPSDIARIRSDALVIRPLPGREDALSVDAELVNMASFEQPWPGLEIVFSDMRGRVVAGRVFTPDEYLGAAPRGAMPVREAVRVHFEIMEPDPSATNYRMQLRELPAAAN